MTWEARGGTLLGRVSRGLEIVSGSGGLELDELLRRGDGELGEQVALRLGQLGALPEGGGWAGEGAGVQALQVAADVVPVSPVVVSMIRIRSSASQ